MSHDESRPLEKHGEDVAIDTGIVGLDEHVGRNLAPSVGGVTNVNHEQAAVSEIAKPLAHPSGCTVDDHGFFYSTFEANDQLLTLGDRTANHADLLALGWRPVRWVHPEHGVVENTVDGGWKWTTRRGDTVEQGGSEKKTIINGKLVAVDGRKVK